MKTLIDILAPYDSIAIAGLAKNAGKTTTLNHLISGFAARGAVLGLTSIGLDGEETDLVTATPKPRIFVPAGTVIATAEQLLTQKKVGVNNIAREILAVTDIATPLGRVVVARALSAGTVMLAGPSMVSQIAPLMGIKREWGAGKIIIDGAAGRKSLAVPEVARAVVLAAGASLGKSMDGVIAETRHAVDIFSLPVADESKPYIYIEGALTDAKLEELGFRDKYIVVQDAAKILITPKALAKLRLGGGTLAVKRRVNLAAVTVNPISPYGAGFDAADFLEKMRAALAVPVYDVVESGGAG